jgi:hypothetical protein
VTPPSLRKIVLAPNLIGASLIDPSARRVLEAWRDGKFVAVMNRELIAFHLRALNRIGLPPELIKRWVYWLASLDKNVFVEKQLPSDSVVDLCEALANISQADAILCWKFPNRRNGPPWIQAHEVPISRLTE